MSSKADISSGDIEDYFQKGIPFRCTLHNTTGSRSAAYVIECDGLGHSIEISYGRIGGKLTTKKVHSLSAFRKKLKEKLAKGYVDIVAPAPLNTPSTNVGSSPSTPASGPHTSTPNVDSGKFYRLQLDAASMNKVITTIKTVRALTSMVEGEMMSLRQAKHLVDEVLSTGEPREVLRFATGQALKQFFGSNKVAGIWNAIEVEEERKVDWSGYAMFKSISYIRKSTEGWVGYDEDHVKVMKLPPQALENLDF